MKREQANLGRGGWRLWLLLVPSSACALLSVGVVAPLRSDAESALRECEALNERSTACELQISEHSALEREHALPRLEELERGLDALLAPAPDPVLLHGLVHTACAASGFDLDALALQPLRAVDASRFGAQLVAQPIDLGGQGTLDSLFAALGALRAAQLPLVIRELHLDRPQPESASFHARVLVWVLGREANAPLLASASETPR